MGGRWKGITVLILSFLALILAAGCSSDKPSGIVDNQQKNVTPLNSLTETQLQLEGRVATIDYGGQTFTFAGKDETIVASSECYIFTMVEGVETPLIFNDILLGDSVKACGNYQDENTFLANRIKVYGDSDCPDYDVSFRDTIVTINYAAGSFTVTGRTETVTIDENTLIWGRTGYINSLGGTDGFTPSDGGTVEESKYQRFVDTVYTFTDLEVGDIVEVKSYIVDENTLLAAVIKVANCPLKKSVTFEAPLASVDCDLRIVNFDGEIWIGTVCPGAILLDADGEVMTLYDFQTGDPVAVKGFPLEGDTLKVCEMILQ